MPMDGRKMSWNRRMIKIDRTDRLQRIRCTAKTWGDALLKLVYPPRCAVCDRLLEPVEIRKLYGDTAYGLSWKEYVHPQCAGELNWVWNPVCMHCGRPLTEETAEYCFDCARKAARTALSMVTEENMPAFWHWRRWNAGESGWRNARLKR